MATSSIVWLSLFLLNLMRGCFIWCLCHVSTLTFPWIPHRDIFLAEMVNEFTERLRGVEGLSTGKLNRGVSWSRVFQQNKAWGWRPRSKGEPKPREFSVCTKHSSIVTAGEGGVWPGLWQMVTALWKTSKRNASIGLIYTYLRCTPSSGFGQTSFCCRCTVSD